MKEFDFGLFLYFAFQELVHEKQQRLKESMKMMGLANWIHWMAWFFKNLFFLLISVVLITIILKVWSSCSNYTLKCDL